jgi:pimeloyl-ACP methyl ester carboxylesterase
MHKAITRRAFAQKGLAFVSATGFLAAPAFVRAASSEGPRWLTLPPTPELPKATREGLAPIGGTKIFFAQFGEGSPVILLHGGLANSNYWGHQIKQLSENFLVTVLDTRGHGRSPVTSDRFGYDLFAGDVLGLMDYLSIQRAGIVGWSDGAITGIQLALFNPNRISSLVSFGANTNLSGLKPGGAKTGVFPLFAARCRAEYLALSPRPNRWGELQRGLGAMWRSEPNFTKAQLSNIRLPVMVADGEHDEIIKLEHTRQIAASIKDAELQIISEASHFAMLQTIDQFNRMVSEFLRKHLSN